MPRKDPYTERVRLRVLSLMKAHANMTQVELARRAKEKQQRVQRFLAGQTPYPPMAFMDRLLGVFNETLLELLRGDEPPIQPLPIAREDVRDVARLLEQRSPEYVQALTALLREGTRVQQQENDARMQPVGGADIAGIPARTTARRRKAS